VEILVTDRLESSPTEVGFLSSSNIKMRHVG